MREIQEHNTNVVCNRCGKQQVVVGCIDIPMDWMLLRSIEHKDDGEDDVERDLCPECIFEFMKLFR